MSEMSLLSWGLEIEGEEELDFSWSWLLLFVWIGDRIDNVDGSFFSPLNFDASETDSGTDADIGNGMLLPAYCNTDGEVDIGEEKDKDVGL